ncbi:MAG: hypothetical protein QXD80_07110 [Acidilobaceae archaeon]
MNIRLLNALTLTYLALATYIIILSLIPALGSLLRGGEWVGFDTGAYYYRDENLEVRFSGLPEGLGKPRVYVYAPNASYKPILLVDFDDRESTVEGYSFYYDSYEVIMSSYNETLLISYIFGKDLTVKKTIKPSNKTVDIILNSTNPFYYKIVIRGRNYTHVNGYPILFSSGYTLILKDIRNLDLVFNVKGVGEGRCKLSFSTPVKATIIRESRDLTSMIVEFHDKNLSIRVEGYIEGVRVSLLSYIASNIINHRLAQILLPIIAFIVTTLGWLLWIRI